MAIAIICTNTNQSQNLRVSKAWADGKKKLSPKAQGQTVHNEQLIIKGKSETQRWVNCDSAV